MHNEFISQTPVWYLLLCLLTGAFFAFLFYFRSKVFSKGQKVFLALLRGILGFSVAFLLLNPLIKTISSLIIKPKVVLLIDDSASMAIAKNFKDAAAGLNALAKDIRGKGFDVVFNTFSGENINELKPEVFKSKKTNISEALNLVNNNFEGQNLSDVILFSDGIINDGVSPTFNKYSFNIHTIGFGDSTQKKDAYIYGISANKLAYMGNNFIVNVDVGAYQLPGKTSVLSIKNDAGVVLAQKKLSYEREDFFQTISFEIPAKELGKQRFMASLEVVQGEVNNRNNQRDFIVDVINGREKILLVAYSPHPDIKAIKSIVESNDLFELNTRIVQNPVDVQSLLKENFDILILHQFPDVDGFHNQFIGRLLSLQKPTMFILGSKSNLSYFNGMQNIVGINSQLNQTDKATAKVNPAFSLFNISDNQADLIAKLPPLTVPFGSYTVYGGSNVILEQYVSDIKVSRPVLAVNLNGARKMAAFLGEGLWQWRLEEFALTQNHQFLDDLITKTLQLISIKEDKSKLRVYPITDVFDVDQPVIFVAEAYNEIFERIFNQDIHLKIKPRSGSERSYDFKITENSSRFSVSNLPVGSYTYTATAKILGKDEVATGQFMVTDNDIEIQNTVADFSLLRTLANANNGEFVLSNNIIELRNSLLKEGFPDKIIAQEELRDIINLRWLLGLIVLIATTEWVIRKYWGSY